MKSLVKNQLGPVSQNIYLPCTAVNAETICADLLEGTYKVFEETSSVGSDAAVTLVYETRVQYRNTGTGKRDYLHFFAKSTTNTDEIVATLKGLTINGILIDEVVIIGFKPVTFA
ncbi:MAG: hypothetical protein M0P91_09665 [Sulfuricurvum sp.]|jgi:hypothetical protein|uniref:hypothetical protein n=1 Tax=Sulfuricurvum sp. TaxID=2025608 RepID=UPI0025FAAA3A|nr:hypothetical protein [Sulfuricurvum sp.]MCK9373455.1 hypothetical protein [Sulfuricurvum sp.]